MVSTLSHTDVARLMADPSPHARADIALKLGPELDNVQLTPAELALAQDIVRALSKDMAVSVRESLASSLRHTQKLPHDVAVLLAKDIDSVAMPILTESPVLSDADLISVVKQGIVSKQEAIAKRATVSEAVVQVMVTEAKESAVAVLMSNNGAEVTEQSFNKVMDRFPHSPAVHEPIVKREKLPVLVAERMIAAVSDKLKDYLVQHHELSPDTAADMLLQSRERATVGLLNGSSDDEVEKMVLQLYRNQRLTPSLVIRALCTGDITFFEMALAVMANVPLTNARVLIHDAGRLGLKSIYSKSNLPPRLLSAVRVALDVVEETKLDGQPHDRERYRRRVLERILTQFEDMNPEDLDYLLDKLDMTASGQAAA